MAGEMGRELGKPVVDEIENARSRYSDPNLLDTINALDSLHEILNAVADLADHIGSESVSHVEVHQTAESAFDSVASSTRQLASAVESDAAEVRKAEAEAIQRIEDGDPRARKRDIAAHD